MYLRWCSTLTFTILLVLVIVPSGMLASKNTVSQQEADDFLAWLSIQSSFSPLKFSVHPVTEDDFGYLGTIKPVATTNIETNEVIFRFPNSFAYEYNSPATVVFHVRDVLTFVREKNTLEKSAWAPYFKILPTTFTTPVHWTDEQLDELQGTSLYNQARRLRDVIKKQYDAYIEFGEIKGEEDVSFANWLWGNSMFRSRTVKTHNRGHKISPVLELFNFGKEANVAVQFNGNNVELVALTDLAAGDLLIISDRKLANRELLDWYGFVVPNNKEDYFPVSLGVNDNREYALKRDLLGYGDHDRTYNLRYDYIPVTLDFYFKFFQAATFDNTEQHSAPEDYEMAFFASLEGLKNELLDRSEANAPRDVLRNAAFADDDNEEMIGSTTELRMCNTVVAMCERILADLTHTLEADKALLADPNTKRPLRDAVILRSSDKEIIQSVQQLAKKRGEAAQERLKLRTEL